LSEICKADHIRCTIANFLRNKKQKKEKVGNIQRHFVLSNNGIYHPSFVFSRPQLKLKTDFEQASAIPTRCRFVSSWRNPVVGR